MTFELFDPAVVLPKLDVVTIDHLPGTFPCTVVVIANEINGLHEMTVTANKVRPIVCHDRRPLPGRCSPLSQPRALLLMGSWKPALHGYRHTRCSAGSNARIRDGPRQCVEPPCPQSLNILGIITRLAFKTTRPLRRTSRQGGCLWFGHGASVHQAGALPNSLSPKIATGGAAIHSVCTHRGVKHWSIRITIERFERGRRFGHR